MAISLQCPHCQKELRLSAAQASRPVVCPACGKVVRAPRANPQGEYFLLPGALLPTAAPASSPPPASQKAATGHGPMDETELAGPAGDELPGIPWGQLAPLIGLVALLLLSLLVIWVYTALAEHGG